MPAEFEVWCFVPARYAHMLTQINELCIRDARNLLSNEENNSKVIFVLTKLIFHTIYY